MASSDAGARQSEEFGRRVREHRLELPGRVSQERLAERCALHRPYIGHVERGEVNPSLHSIVRIAAALDVDPAQLVAGLRP